MNTEGFRPETLDQIVGQDHAVTVLKGMVASISAGRTFPHILMYGPPGVGKTTAAIATARAILGPAWRDNFLELNASDARGIDVVRERIKPYVGQMPQGGAVFKFLFLDEVDMMTFDAQQALRRIMEQGSSTTRFVLACNSVSKVTDAIQSRCAVLAFKPLTNEDMHAILTRAAEREKIPVDQPRIESIVAHSHGDARAAINMLLMGGSETDKYVRLDSEIGLLFEERKEASIERFIGFLREEGFADWEDVLASIGEYVIHNPKMLTERKIAIITQIGTCAFRCTMVSAPLLQIRSFLYSTVLV